MTITLRLSKEIEAALRRRWEDLPARALEALALEGYRDGVLSRGQVSEMLGLNVWQTEALLRQREVCLNYGAEDLEDDRHTNDSVLRP